VYWCNWCLKTKRIIMWSRASSYSPIWLPNHCAYSIIVHSCPLFSNFGTWKEASRLYITRIRYFSFIIEYYCHLRDPCTYNIYTGSVQNVKYTFIIYGAESLIRRPVADSTWHDTRMYSAAFYSDEFYRPDRFWNAYGRLD